METKRLQIADTAPIITLKTDSSEPVEIEVAAGESRYHIEQADEGEAHFTFHLRHPDSQVRVTGKVTAAGEGAPRLSTRVVHHAPRTRAETIVRTVAWDSAHPHYEGLIKIEKDADGAESFLNHHSLLLGNAAKSWTLPSLEILADQVKCSHAATIRTLTDLDLFYLRSRGIASPEARELLINAFFADVGGMIGQS